MLIFIRQKCSKYAFVCTFLQYKLAIEDQIVAFSPSKFIKGVDFEGSGSLRSCRHASEVKLIIRELVSKCDNFEFESEKLQIARKNDTSHLFDTQRFQLSSFEIQNRRI